MATKTIYITVRVDLASDDDVITDEQVQDFLSETEYEIPSAAGLRVDDTELCGLNED